MIILKQEQQRIVDRPNGVKLVISGPGTGKKTTVTHFLSRLLETGKARPEEVLAVTFTVKAAQEIKERVKSMTGQNPDVFTIHSFARRFLCAFPPSGFTEDFAVINERQEWRLIPSHTDCL